MIFELKEDDGTNDAISIQLGDLLIVGYLKNGKSTIKVTALKGRDFLIMQASSSNQIIVKADESIK